MSSDAFTPWIKHIFGKPSLDSVRTCIFCGKDVRWTDPDSVEVTEVYEHNSRYFIKVPPGNIVKCKDL